VDLEEEEEEVTFSNGLDDIECDFQETMDPTTAEPEKED
jgi:hypothetical protein